MSLSVAQLASLLLLPVFLGMGILRACAITFATDRLAFFGWCWVGGATGTALVTFVWLWTGAPVDWALPLQVVVLLVAAGLFVAGRRREPIAPAPAPSFPIWERGLFSAVIVVALAVTIARALLGSLEPLFQGDDAAFWSMKGKIIFASGGFNHEYAEVMAIPRIVYHKDYPLSSTLLHVWTFVHAGEITHVANRLPIQMFGVAFVLIFAAALRRVTRPAVAAALLLCVMPRPEMVHQNRTAYVDLCVAICVVMAFDAWNRCSRSEDDATGRSWWRLFCVALGSLVWLKHEGLLYAMAMLAAWAVSRIASGGAHKRVEKRFLLVPLGFLLLTWSFNTWFGFQSYVIESQTPQAGLVTFIGKRVERLPIIVEYFAERIFLEPVHSSFLPLAFVVLLVAMLGPVWRSDLRLPTLALLFAWMGYVAIFVTTPAEITSHLRTAAERVSFQLVPSIAVWLGAFAPLLHPGFGTRPYR